MALLARRSSAFDGLDRDARESRARAALLAARLSASVAEDDDLLPLHFALHLADDLHARDDRRSDFHTSVARDQLDLVEHDLGARLGVAAEVDVDLRARLDGMAAAAVVDDGVGHELPRSATSKSLFRKRGENVNERSERGQATVHSAPPRPLRSRRWIPHSTSSLPTPSIASSSTT